MKTAKAEGEGIIERAISFERQAHQLRTEDKIEEAFAAYDQAGALYREAEESLKAAVCYASAATCWNMRTGWQPLRNAATRNDYAAHEALKAGHFDYACSLFGEAALLYEKEGDFNNYSNCFWWSQIADARRSWSVFVHRKKDVGLSFSNDAGWRERLTAFFRWFLNIFGRISWGYGERPLRTLVLGAVIIFGTAVIYAVSGSSILVNGVARAISFPESLYLSIVTFTTVGFGDYLPLGWTRILAAHEALAGIFLTPLFLVALTRRYLRMYR